MNFDELISKIASESGLSEEEVRRRVEEKQKELGGLITPEGAAHVVANELGINLFSGASKTRDIKIENIIPGMQSVDVVGRVRRIFPAREFTRSDGGKGKVSSLILGDDTATIRVVFWGKDTEKLEKIQEGDILRIRDGYTKEDLNGEPELHIGSRTRVILNPPDIKPEQFPEVETQIRKIAELQDGMPSVDVLCKVMRIYEVREFTRDDGSTGRVVNLVVADDTGRARLVLWGDDVSMVEEGKISEGDVLKVVKGYVKVRMNEPEIHVGRFGKVVLNPDGAEALAELPEEKIVRKEMKELKAGDRAEIRGAIVDVADVVRVFDRKSGKGVVFNVVIDDGTANMRAAFYDKLAETLLNIPLERIIAGEAEEDINKRKEELLGREIVVIASVRTNDFTGKEELVVEDLNLNPDPRSEVQRLLKEAKSIMGG
jgi:replication factor A1